MHLVAVTIYSFAAHFSLVAITVHSYCNYAALIVTRKCEFATVMHFIVVTKLSAENEYSLICYSGVQ